MRKTLLLTLTVVVLQAAAQDIYSDHLQGVDEYRPAPGQFINKMPLYEEGDDAQSMAEKCTLCFTSDNPDERGVVCLGAFGGYMTFHFDHPVANIEDVHDFAIFGNSFLTNLFDVQGGAAEPGIVMVSQDLNHNGQPDDPWYELSGSADTDSADHENSELAWDRRLIHGYEITYHRPAALQAVPWTDNQGQTGQVERMDAQGNTQEYWPLWIGDDELTFQGTRLPRNAWFLQQGKFKQQWVCMFLDHGYVDNQRNVDTLKCAFDLAWAVDPLTRQPVKLTHADFFRVYTAMNQTVPLLGETSTEVAGAIDLHLQASIDAMQQQEEPVTTFVRSCESWGDIPEAATLYRFGPVVVERRADGSVRKRMKRKYQ